MIIKGAKRYYTEIMYVSQGIVRNIIHLYCLAVQAGFYSDVVEC